MLNDVIADARQRMARSVEAFKQELAKMRTGRAHPSLLDHVRFDFYGTETPITKAANVHAEDSRTLTISPWDKSTVSAIERALRESDLGLNPNVAGTVIRVPLPSLTEERRRDLIKVVRAEAEHARVAIRNVRRDANQMLKELAKDKDITEDDAKRGEETVQKATDTHIKSIDDLLAGKEKEMLEI
jgi:ribosome recycling factor